MWKNLVQLTWQPWLINHEVLSVDIEALRSKLRRIFDPQGIIMFPIHSLTPQQTTGNALAVGFKTFINGVYSVAIKTTGYTLISLLCLYQEMTENH